MKILYYLPGTILGGAETQLLTLCQALPEIEFDLTVVTRGSDLGHPFWKELARYSQVVASRDDRDVARIIDAVRPDLIHYSHNPTISNALDLLNLDIPTIEIIHGRIHFPNDSTTTPKHHTSHVVAVSEDAKKFFLDSLPKWDRKKISVIPNGIDTDISHPTLRLNRSEKLRIIHSGRMCEGDKQYRKIIQACHNSIAEDNWELWLLGDGVDLDSTYRYADSLARGHVKFFGYVTNPAQYLTQADLYISRSESEGFGLSIAEAASCGLPVTMWDCGGVSRYFKHGDTALIAKTDAEFERNLRILAGDKRLRQTMGCNARELAISKFSSSVMASSYADLYRKLIQEKNPPIISIQKNGTRVVGISNPNFVGVTNAVKSWVGDGNYVPVTKTCKIGEVLPLILKNQPEIVILGGDANYQLLAREIKRIKNPPKILMTWHSTFAFNSFAPNDGTLLADWVEHARCGLIDRMGFVREGMDEAFEGIQFVYFPNRVPLPSIVIPKIKKIGPPQIGVFGTDYAWKNTGSLVIGASLIQPAVVHVNKIDPITERLALLAGCRIKKHGDLSHEKFLKVLGSMDCNIQGGFTESFGLTFCESYRLGVPCLTTPGVKVLPNYDFTEVRDPDNITAITKKLVELIREPRVEQVNRELDKLDLKNKTIIDRVLEDMCELST